MPQPPGRHARPGVGGLALDADTQTSQEPGALAAGAGRSGVNNSRHREVEGTEDGEEKAAKGPHVVIIKLEAPLPTVSEPSFTPSVAGLMGSCWVNGELLG